jgi:hypothetical protein
MPNFQRPANIWLCLLSLLWFALGGWYCVKAFLVGKFFLAALCGAACLAAGGLWFQSRAAAWVLIALMVLGIGYTLTILGTLRWSQAGFRICYGYLSLSLLWKYLKEHSSA